ncbi:MAG: Hpt domain [Verrucomicrobiota bacterium]|jgi:HPt (histidine-containing phosphotransfer) domain-containing protein
MNESRNLDPAAMERLRKLGGEAFVSKMVQLFVDYAGEKVAAARQAQAAGNLSGVADAVHPIKSSAGNIGACRVQELAQRIEQLAKQGQGESAGLLVGELEAAFACVKTELLQRRAEPTTAQKGNA